MGNQIFDAIRASYVDDERRRHLMFHLLNLLLAAISLIMSAVNLITGEYELMAVTLIFTVLCLSNCLFIKTGWIKRSVVTFLFTVEAMVLLVYFVLSGVPQGFSVLWTLLVPSVSLYVLGPKIGLRFSLLTLLMIVFFFWIPFGRELLLAPEHYGSTFMTRFPFVYICMFIASLYIDAIRLGVYRKLKETEENARKLYRHDALTGIYSRHAFYEELQKKFATPATEKVSIVIFDIDDFKIVNDIYGHNAGDEVLKRVSSIILHSTCEHCISCRWGGEEFLVLMPCTHDPLVIAESIRAKVANTEVVYGEHRIRVTLSVGIAVANFLDKHRLSDFINRADKAMYTSKAEGKNRTTLEMYG